MTWPERRVVGPLLAIVAIVAAGCTFKINPAYAPPTADLGGPAHPLQPFDLAPSLNDQSSAPGDPGTGTFDLASPAASDLGSPCVRVIEPFAQDPSATWTLLGDATFDASQGGLQLTSINYNVAGSAFYSRALPGGAFDATFQFRISDGSGADGMAFVVARAASAGALTPFGNGVLNTGYGLGYLGMNGFAVELDSFMNVGNGDPNNNHVSLVRTSDGAHQISGTPAKPLRSSDWQRAHVRLTATRLTVEINGEPTIAADLPSGFALPTGDVYYGFTGASGTLDDRHAVSDLTLIVGPAGVCF